MRTFPIYCGPEELSGHHGLAELIVMRIRRTERLEAFQDARAPAEIVNHQRQLVRVVEIKLKRQQLAAT